MSTAGTLTRGLELLRLLNETYPLQVRDLHEASGLPKPTISRLLTTLRKAGYIQRDGEHGYRPASKLNVLSAGVTSQSWIHEVAAPALERLAQKIRWPSDFAVFEGRGMSLRYSTRATAPIPISDAINTSEIPMLDSDTGRAFLAFAPAEQSDRIRRALVRIDPRLDPDAPHAGQIDALLGAIREGGYATRGENFTFALATTIAVAVTVAGRSVGALNVICPRRVIKPKDVPKRYLEPLRQTAAEIGGALCWDGFVVTNSVRAASAAEAKTRIRTG